MAGPTPVQGTDHRASARNGGRMVDRLREQAMVLQPEREPRKAQRPLFQTVECRQSAAPKAPALPSVVAR